MKMLIQTTGSAAVCLKRVAEAHFVVPRSQRRTSGAIRSKHPKLRRVLNAETAVVISFLLFCVCLRIHIHCLLHNVDQ